MLPPPVPEEDAWLELELALAVVAPVLVPAAPPVPEEDAWLELALALAVAAPVLVPAAPPDPGWPPAPVEPAPVLALEAPLVPG
jgi:hypothetical protein